MAHEQSIANPKLEQLAIKRFPAPIKFPFTAYSHCHDLLAIVTSTWDVSVFRITNGQLAFHIRQKAKELEVTALGWKADGTCLGVGWSDGHYAIHDGGSGKQMQVISLQSEGGEDDEWLLDLRIKDPPRAAAPATAPPAQQQVGAPKAEPEPELEPEPEPPKPEPPRVGCFGWMGHEIGRSAKRKVAEQITTDDWYDDADEGEVPAAKSKHSSDAILTDLPRAITTLDVTKVLPRLSTIQSHSTPQTKVFGSLNKFGSQQSTNNLFHTRSDATSNLVQSVLVCQEDGTVQVLLDETVKIGSSSVPGRPILHAAHPQSGSHSILSDMEDSSLALSFMDLPLPALSGPLLHVIATNTKRIQILLEYVVQTVRCIEHDFATSVEFPQKMLDSLSTFLESEIESDPVLNLFHLAMTGGFCDPVKEWLVDILKPRHVVTWDQTMNSMYTHLQNHIFINLLPALDRFSTAVTTLRGLANFYEGSTKFDCPAELFSKILEHIDSLRLVAQKMQLIIQTEHRQFRAFHRWIKMEIDIASAGPGSSGAIEQEEREVPNLDYSLILPYIKDPLMRSKLTPNVETRPEMMDHPYEETSDEADEAKKDEKNDPKKDPPKMVEPEKPKSCSKDEFFENPIIRDINYQRTKEALERLNASKSDADLKIKDVHDPLSLLNLPTLTAGLMGHVRVALKRITDWQSRMLSRPTSISLPMEPGTAVLDMKMTASEHQTSHQNSTTRLLALHPDSTNLLHVLQISHAIPATPSKRPSTFPATPSCKLTTHGFPPGQLLDAKWIPHAEASFLSLFKSEDGQTRIVKHTLGEEEESSLDSEIQQAFPGKGQFKPMKLVVGGRKGKSVCVAIGNKGREWRVFDLDAGLQSEEGAADEGAGVDDDEMLDVGEE